MNFLFTRWAVSNIFRQLTSQQLDVGVLWGFQKVEEIPLDIEVLGQKTGEMFSKYAEKILNVDNIKISKRC